ncbi:hypothetical protein [Motilibacter deserti]|uniref:Acyl-CoA dehydrogenase-like protein n=1 Tax=Motilibacter deserti TaxID=2714956 RepID=A0ABX0H3Z9_9ACTN|nr:hypothetical protein [Motilibacter deserti]NHC16128.1 hypothetical protein [Motilibacter deserti]
MDEFTAHLRERAHTAFEGLGLARAQGDEFGSALWEADLEDLRRLGAEHGLTLLAGLERPRRDAGGRTGSRLGEAAAGKSLLTWLLA